jgi:two-component system response regulator LytT
MLVDICGRVNMSEIAYKPRVVLVTADGRPTAERPVAVPSVEARPAAHHSLGDCSSVIARSAKRPPVPLRVVARRKKDLVFLSPDELWAFEAADRLTFVHSRRGRFDVDLSLAAIEASFGPALTRVHRNWLVNLEFVRALERDGGEMTLFIGCDFGSEGIRVPVSSHCARRVRHALLRDSTGLRRNERDVG